MRDLARRAVTCFALLLSSNVVCHSAFPCSPVPLRIDSKALVIEGRPRIITEEEKGQLGSSSDYERWGIAEVSPTVTVQNELKLQPPFQFHYYFFYSADGCVRGQAPLDGLMQRLYLRVSEEDPLRIELVGMEHLELGVPSKDR